MRVIIIIRAFFFSFSVSLSCHHFSTNRLLISFHLKAQLVSFLHLSIYRSFSPFAAICTVTTNRSRVLLLLNAISFFDVATEGAYLQIQRDIQTESLKYGTVVEIVITRPSPEDREALADLTLDDSKRDPLKMRLLASPGKVYIRFADAQDAHQAMLNLTGKAFQGRMIMTAFYSEDAFDKRDF